VGSTALASAGLANLQRLSVARCNISLLHPRAFGGLLNLVELDLASNRLAAVPSHLFPNTLSLMALSLAGNPISSVPAGAFSHLRQLTQLDLSHCRITSLAPGAFLRVDRLERLHLHGNQLAGLAAPAAVLPAGLHGISLHDNPWRCDCRLRALRGWLASSNVPRPSEPLCRAPRRLQGFRLAVVSAAEFACPPALSPTSMLLTVGQRRNVSLTCRVTADPPAHVSWTFNGLLVDSHHPRMRVLQLQGDMQGTVRWVPAPSSLESPCPGASSSSSTPPSPRTDRTCARPRTGPGPRPPTTAWWWRPTGRGPPSWR
jgi:hypothetical protein